jgi:hypothetical protein
VRVCASLSSRQVLVKGYVHHVVIVWGSDVIARHEHSYERESSIFDPLHYLRLLEHKSQALEQASPLAGWQLPDCFLHLRRLLEVCLKKHGRREYILVLRLLETFAFEVYGAIEDALRMNAISFDSYATSYAVASSVGHRGWTCRTGRIFLFPRYELPRLRIT